MARWFRGRAWSLVALVLFIGFVGVGLALMAGGAVLAMYVPMVAYGGVGPDALQAPGVVVALGGELIAAALLVGWRVGAGITAEEEDDRAGLC